MWARTCSLSLGLLVITEQSSGIFLLRKFMIQGLPTKGLVSLHLHTLKLRPGGHHVLVRLVFFHEGVRQVVPLLQLRVLQGHRNAGPVKLFWKLNTNSWSFLMWAAILLQNIIKWFMGSRVPSYFENSGIFHFSGITTSEPHGCCAGSKNICWFQGFKPGFQFWVFIGGILTILGVGSVLFFFLHIVCRSRIGSREGILSGLRINLWSGRCLERRGSRKNGNGWLYWCRWWWKGLLGRSVGMWLKWQLSLFWLIGASGCTGWRGRPAFNHKRA